MPMKTVRYRVRASGPMQRLELDAGKLARPVLRGRDGSNAVLLPDPALETKARFINQIMTGDRVGRRAEDVGGQELSYAEVKAIASGNPAVLTLAEADAELQRLNILRRSHADEQFLARRSLRDLPDSIARLRQRLAGLTADRATMTAHDEDAFAVGDPLPALGQALDALPQFVTQDRRVLLGTYRGLRFGMILHPQWNPQVYLEGAVTRLEALSREHQGPRAVWNAVERLGRSYAAECERTRKDLEIAQGQLRDFQARVGQPFAHEDYLSRLTGLRDRLRAGLSGSEPQEGEPTVADLAEKIKALRGGNAVEAIPQRSVKRQVSAEQPVTTRILGREQPGEWQRRVGEAEERGAARG